MGLFIGVALSLTIYQYKKTHRSVLVILKWRLNMDSNQGPTG